MLWCNLLKPGHAPGNAYRIPNRPSPLACTMYTDSGLSVGKWEKLAHQIMVNDVATTDCSNQLVLVLVLLKKSLLGGQHEIGAQMPACNTSPPNVDISMCTSDLQL